MQAVERVTRRITSSSAYIKFIEVEHPYRFYVRHDLYEWRTKGGRRIYYPSAYSKKGWSNMMYVPASIQVEVGERVDGPLGVLWEGQPDVIKFYDKYNPGGLAWDIYRILEGFDLTYDGYDVQYPPFPLPPQRALRTLRRYGQRILEFLHEECATHRNQVAVRSVYNGWFSVRIVVPNKDWYTVKYVSEGEPVVYDLIDKFTFLQLSRVADIVRNSPRQGDLFFRPLSRQQAENYGLDTSYSWEPRKNLGRHRICAKIAGQRVGADLLCLPEGATIRHPEHPSLKLDAGYYAFYRTPRVQGGRDFRD